jgi:hypothetical protein
VKAHYALNAEPGHINLSPVAFHLWAKHYYQCRVSFKCSDPFSPVPYFLLCRAIELHFKAILLETQNQAAVKTSYGHNLIQAYRALPPAFQTLSQEQIALLDQANRIYRSKGFEYINIGDAACGFSTFPDLPALDALAKQVLGNDAQPGV